MRAVLSRARTVALAGREHHRHWDYSSDVVACVSPALTALQEAWAATVTHEPFTTAPLY